MEMRMENTVNFPSYSMIRNITAVQMKGAVMDSFGVQPLPTLMLMANMDSVLMNVSRIPFPKA